jgi:hypothetical protein
MRARNHAVAIALVVGALVGSGRAAYAQDGAVAPLLPRAPASVERAELMKPVTRFEEGWARRLQAVLDGMTHLLDAEPVEAQQALGAKLAAPTPARDRTVPPARTAWLPGGALREAIARSPVQLSPLAVLPATESAYDARSEHLVLLGIRMQLPWIVP